MCPDIVYQVTGHWYFGFGLFTERHAHGVANAVGQQGTNAHGTLDATVFALSSLGHAEMKRIVHVFLFHLAHQKAHGAYHDNRV